MRSEQFNLKWGRFPALLMAGVINALGVTIFLYPVNLYDSGVSGTSMLLAQLTHERVLNRVRSSYFPNTISGVIYQSGQFSPVASGRLAYRLEAGVNDECMRAAQEVLGGTITLNCLYFRTNNGIIQGTIIGHHVFY